MGRYLSGSKILKITLLLQSLLFVACVNVKKDKVDEVSKSPDATAPAPEVPAPPSTIVDKAGPNFYFDTNLGKCINEKGEEGLNTNTIGPCSDLSNKDLSGLNFAGRDLRGSDFSHSVLDGTDFSRSLLSGAHFDYVDLSTALFADTTSTGATFTGSVLPPEQTLPTAPVVEPVPEDPPANDPPAEEPPAEEPVIEDPVVDEPVVESPPVWILCANEHGHCQFSGTAQVRYGINGVYYTKTVTNGIGCNNGVFGDPAYGFLKICEYSNLKPSSPSDQGPSSDSNQWLSCAQENGFCTFTGRAQVRYGILGKYVIKEATDGIACNNSVFGDPAYGYLKTCEYIKFDEN